MSQFKRAITLGLLSWLLPFVYSFFFYNREGTLLINYDVFKSMMFVVSMTVGVILLVNYFKHIKSNYLRNAGYVGITWFVMNLLLDGIVLIPLSGMSLQDYVNQIGIRYVAIPILAVGFGYILEKKLR